MLQNCKRSRTGDGEGYAQVFYKMNITCVSYSKGSVHKSAQVEPQCRTGLCQHKCPQMHQQEIQISFLVEMMLVRIIYVHKLDPMHKQPMN